MSLPSQLPSPGSPGLCVAFAIKCPHYWWSGAPWCHRLETLRQLELSWLDTRDYFRCDHNVNNCHHSGDLNWTIIGGILLLNAGNYLFLSQNLINFVTKICQSWSFVWGSYLNLCCIPVKNFSLKSLLLLDHRAACGNVMLWHITADMTCVSLLARSAFQRKSFLWARQGIQDFCWLFTLYPPY